MDFNTTESLANSSSNIRSEFYCPLTPNFTWDLNNTTYAWVLVAIRCIASPCTILLNLLVIVAMRRKKVLEKPSAILLSSMAVTDLLIGAVAIPLSVAVDIKIFRQTSFAHICLLDALNVSLNDFLCMCSLYHLTVIAWERYVAIRKWMDCKVIITTDRVKKLAIAGWLSMFFVAVLGDVMQSAGVDNSVVEGWYTGLVVVGIIFVILIFYFYIMVYLGVRKGKINKNNQVTALVKAKLESKVAKTTFMVTAVVLFSFAPWAVMWFFSVTSSVFRSGETCVYLNSLINPIIYCYRDRRFRTAVQELLGLKKRRAIQPAVGAMRSVRRMVPRDSQKNVPEVESAVKDTRLLRSESCNIATVEDCFRQNNKNMLKRSVFTPALRNTCFEGEILQKHQSSILTTTAIIHVQRGVQNKPREENL
ncbi:hypothetical protein ACROYT_G000632 [Oculina patagonica]